MVASQPGSVSTASQNWLEVVHSGAISNNPMAALLFPFSYSSHLAGFAFCWNTCCVFHPTPACTQDYWLGTLIQYATQVSSWVLHICVIATLPGGGAVVRIAMPVVDNGSSIWAYMHRCRLAHSFTLGITFGCTYLHTGMHSCMGKDVHECLLLMLWLKGYFNWWTAHS